jgi:hypothetical protein
LSSPDGSETYDLGLYAPNSLLSHLHPKMLPKFGTGPFFSTVPDEKVTNPFITNSLLSQKEEMARRSGILNGRQSVMVMYNLILDGGFVYETLKRTSSWGCKRS